MSDGRRVITLTSPWGSFKAGHRFEVPGAADPQRAAQLLKDGLAVEGEFTASQEPSADEPKQAEPKQPRRGGKRKGA